MERGGHGHPGQRPLRGHRRPPVDAGVGHRPLRDGLQPLLPGPGRRRAGRPGLLPGPRHARHLRPCVPRGSAGRGPGRPLPAGDRRRWSSAAACPATPTPGSCPSSGSSRRSPWAWGPINAIYQARFNRYLAHRGIADTSRSHVWCFLGDGECDEPESLGALSIAAREGLDNLDLRRQLQPAAPRRPGAGQRQGHPGAGVGVPGRGLERDQGRLGLRSGTTCWPPTPTGLSSSA